MFPFGSTSTVSPCLLAKNFLCPNIIPLQPCICNSIRFAKVVLSKFSVFRNIYLHFMLIQYFLTWLFESCSVKFEVNESHCTWVYLYLNLTKMCLLKEIPRRFICLHFLLSLLLLTFHFLWGIRYSSCSLRSLVFP